jgi:hypothetical protein
VRLILRFSRDSIKPTQNWLACPISDYLEEHKKFESKCLKNKADNKKLYLFPSKYSKAAAVTVNEVGS